jgi:hypothetical protein
MADGTGTAPVATLKPWSRQRAAALKKRYSIPQPKLHFQLMEISPIESAGLALNKWINHKISWYDYMNTVSEVQTKRFK